jgi:hypothetical protein
MKDKWMFYLGVITGIKPSDHSTLDIGIKNVGTLCLPKNLFRKRLWAILISLYVAFGPLPEDGESIAILEQVMEVTE